MTKDEALKLALEALVEVKSWKSPTRWDGCFDKEITAIKEALSSCQCPECKVVLHASDCAVHNEPAYPNGKCNCGAQRKPLTDEEIRKANHHMVDGAYDYSFKQGVKWSEYKHGIKD